MHMHRKCEKYEKQFMNYTLCLFFPAIVSYFTSKFSSPFCCDMVGSFTRNKYYAGILGDNST